MEDFENCDHKPKVIPKDPIKFRYIFLTALMYLHFVLYPIVLIAIQITAFSFFKLNMEPIWILSLTSLTSIPFIILPKFLMGERGVISLTVFGNSLAGALSIMACVGFLVFKAPSIERIHLLLEANFLCLAYLGVLILLGFFRSILDKIDVKSP